MNAIFIKQCLVLCSVFVLITGCATVPQELGEFEPIVRPVAPPAPSYENGSLFQARSISLFEDARPYRVGDILTIVLQESTSASKTAATSTKKDDDISIDVPTIFGVSPTYNGNQLLDLTMSPSREFEGEGDSSQSNSLNGEITVTVVDILSNGNLVVKGEKWFTLNQGKEYIRIAGVIRPQDVQPDNTVTSSKLADAQIAYSGEGFVADSNQQGWFSRFLSSEWWPF
jgi:flagellar L-ring protein precursor FlgH